MAPRRRGGRPVRRALPPLPQTKGMSLREFPGLIRQLPQHKPWMIAIGFIFSFVVLAACGFGTWQLLKDEGVPLGAPTDGPNVERRDISSREIDSTPLALEDVFPIREIVIDPAIPPYTMIGDPQLTDACELAGDLEVKRLLEGTDCTQLVRATFDSYDGGHFVTAGILNLLDNTKATQFSDELRNLVDTDQGRLRGFISDPNVNSIMGRAPSRLSWEVRGHFLLYAVVVRKDGAEIPPDDQRTASVTDDMLRLYLRLTVIQNWSTAPSQGPSDAAASEGAEGTDAEASAPPGP